MKELGGDGLYFKKNEILGVWGELEMKIEQPQKTSCPWLFHCSMKTRVPVSTISERFGFELCY